MRRLHFLGQTRLKETVASVAVAQDDAKVEQLISHVPLRGRHGLVVNIIVIDIIQANGRGIESCLPPRTKKKKNYSNNQKRLV